MNSKLFLCLVILLTASYETTIKPYHPCDPLVYQSIIKALPKKPSKEEQKAALQKLLDLDPHPMESALHNHIKQLTQETGLFNITGPAYGQTPFLDAAKHNDLPFMKELHAQGCDTQALNKAQQNALFYACLNNDIESLTYLIENNLADPNFTFWHGETPLSLAFFHKDKTMYHYLRSRGALINKAVLKIAIIESDLETIKHLHQSLHTKLDEKELSHLVSIAVRYSKNQQAIIKYLTMQNI